MPDWPSSKRDHEVLAFNPRGVTAPTPVIHTLRIVFDSALQNIIETLKPPFEGASSSSPPPSSSSLKKAGLSLKWSEKAGREEEAADEEEGERRR